MSIEKNNKSKAEELKEKLFSKKKNGCVTESENVIKEADSFCEGYKTFLDAAKTEREACAEAVKLAEKNGFSPFDKSKKYQPNDRFYFVNRNKSVILGVMGSEPLENGLRISAAHIDSPRLDLKQMPVYESDEICYFKTHYYGGIKKYQWPTIPLSLHGVIFKSDGSRVDVCIGENDDEPAFCVSDLLPHLAQEQMKRTPGELIKGEELNIIIGSRPFKDDEVSERVKLSVLNLLFEKYGITEDDFLSAELEAVPAFKARDIGFDRALIGAYGQGDRVCAYTALQAILNCRNPKKTCLTVLTDKEETGSDGNTGLNSSYLKFFVYTLAEMYGAKGHDVLSASECLSADVNAAFDPTFPDVFDKKNSTRINYGVAVTKFHGARGKSGTSDASAEFVSRMRLLLDKNQVIWQTGELGRVDLGGGGTVAMYIANLDVEVIDVGVPVISMHAPYELTSKFDVYMAFRAFSVFFAD